MLYLGITTVMSKLQCLSRLHGIARDVYAIVAPRTSILRRRCSDRIRHTR
jgi:hypothetical protein